MQTSYRKRKKRKRGNIDTISKYGCCIILCCDAVLWLHLFLSLPISVCWVLSCTPFCHSVNPLLPPPPPFFCCRSFILVSMSHALLWPNDWAEPQLILTPCWCARRWLHTGVIILLWNFCFTEATDLWLNAMSISRAIRYVELPFG